MCVCLQHARAYMSTSYRQHGNIAQGERIFYVIFVRDFIHDSVRAVCVWFVYCVLCVCVPCVYIYIYIYVCDLFSASFFHFPNNWCASATYKREHATQRSNPRTGTQHTTTARCVRACVQNCANLHRCIGWCWYMFAERGVLDEANSIVFVKKCIYYLLGPFISRTTFTQSTERQLLAFYIPSIRYLHVKLWNSTYIYMFTTFSSIATLSFTQCWRIKKTE